jgi:hypothetical protein
MRGRSVLIAAGLIGLGVLGIRFATSRSGDSPARERSTSETASVETSAPTETVVIPPPTLPPPVRTGSVRPTTSSIDPAPDDSATAKPPRTTEALLAALGSTDDFVVVDAADELIERKETRALPSLVAFEIKERAHAAPSVIDALGHLAGAADSSGRKSATDRLIALLAQERARGARESAGNVLSLYAALGETHDPRAASTLEVELLDPGVRLAAKTVIVASLERLKQHSSVAALRTLREQLVAMSVTDKMEEGIRRELLAAVDHALRVLS